MEENPCAKYLRLRRRFFLLAISLMAIAISNSWLSRAAKRVLPAGVWEPAWRILPYVLSAMMLAFVVTNFQLLFWRCPRCGGFFTLSWWSSWPTNRCKHCGLDTDPARANLPFSRIAYEEWVASTHASALAVERGADSVPRWRHHAAGLLQISAALIAILAIIAFAMAVRWLIVELRQGAEYRPLFWGIQLTLGQSLLVGAVVAVALAVLLWLAAGWIQRPKRSP